MDRTREDEREIQRIIAAGEAGVGDLMRSYELIEKLYAEVAPALIRATAPVITTTSTTQPHAR